MPPLLKLILMRVALGLLTLFLVSIVVFGATQALPGDAAKAILGKNAVNVAMYEALRHQFGLDRPLIVQYGDWLGGIVTGNAGDSVVHSGVPVASVLRDALINSGILVLVAALISVPLSILLGAFQAYLRDRPFDAISNFLNLLLVALPEFVIGIGLILLFATGVMRVLPAVSQIDADASVWSQWKGLVLPAATLALAIIPYVSRMLRASTIDVLESDYVMMARLKGLPNRVVLWRHSLPNAIGPTLQTIALSLAWLAGDIVIVEYVFNYPGIGMALVDAVAARDMAVVQAICILIAGAYVVLNLLADIATILINPRLRTGLR